MGCEMDDQSAWRHGQAHSKLRVVSHNYVQLTTRHKNRALCGTNLPRPRKPSRTRRCAATRDLVMGLGTGRDALRSDLRVDPDNQLDTVERHRIADVVDLFSLDDPELSVMNFAPFLSLVSASGGRDSAS